MEEETILSEDTLKEKRNYVKRVTAIAKTYGFDVEISDSFIYFWRI